MAFDVNSVIEWCKNNWVIIVLVLGIAFLIYMYMKKKPKFKPTDRCEIERLKFIEREKLNTTSMKYLWRGKKLMGLIKTLSASKYEGQDVINIVFKPAFFGLKIPDIFSKDIPLIISDIENSDYDYEGHNFTIDEFSNLNLLLGIRYDIQSKKVLHKFIVNDNVTKSDMEQHSAVQFTEGQKLSTYGNSDNAAALVLKEKELQTELAKKRGKVSSI